MFSHFLLSSLSLIFGVKALDNGLGLTPQMGWSSWNAFNCYINESLISSIIDAMVSSGLSDVGYKYVNLDDCWQSTRDSNGTIVPDPDTFPNGITPLVKQAHDKGLMFGLYSDAGTKTCKGRPGSYGYETIDANTYAAWEVDYLKYDYCSVPDNLLPNHLYPVMSQALLNSSRKIFFSLCDANPKYIANWNWGAAIGNSWRTTIDIKDKWSYMISNFDLNGPSSSAGPGGWNDPDMLEVGNGGMSTIEYMTHFSLWCIMKAPLIIGCDIRSMSSDAKSILTNTEAIAINQDRMGIQANMIVNYSVCCQVYGGRISNDGYTIAFLNRDDSKYNNISITWDKLSLRDNATYTVRDLWLHKDIGKFTQGFTAENIPPHGTTFVKLSLVYD